MYIFLMKGFDPLHMYVCMYALFAPLPPKYDQRWL